MVDSHISREASYRNTFAMLKIAVVVALVACALARQPALPRPRLDGRIVGGTDAKEGELPYQISMKYYGSHRCGGSVISEEWVVTAAHCVQGVSAEDLEIMVGSTKVNGGSMHKVAYIAYHPKYDASTTDWDIAVIKVAQPFKFSELVQPIALPSANEEPAAGSMAIVSGWGYTMEGGGQIPTNLQKVTVPIVSREECNNSYGGITERMICAGVQEGGKDACQGDSGGPLVIDGKLQGVVSWGAGCARPKYPGVYSRVSSMRSFVTEETGV